MESRYAMSNRKRRIHVEAPHTDAGKRKLEHYRELNKNDWRGCRIVGIIQALPATIKVYRVYKI